MGTIDFIIGFLLGFFLSWPGIISFCLAGIWFEYVEWRGMAIFMSLVAAVTAFFFFKVPFEHLVYYAIGYLVLGITWSVWRYKRFVDREVEKFNELNDNAKRNTKDMTLHHLSPLSNVDKIVGWIIAWPFSFIENVTRDIIHWIEVQVRTTLRKIYEYVYNSAIKNIKE
jgi:hypothetical protein